MTRGRDYAAEYRRRVARGLSRAEVRGHARLTKSGQPVMGSMLTVCLSSGDGTMDIRVIGKLFGRKGSADLIGVIVEDPEDGGRASFDWPLTHEDGTTCGLPCGGR